MKGKGSQRIDIKDRNICVAFTNRNPGVVTKYTGCDDYNLKGLKNEFTANMYGGILHLMPKKDMEAVYTECFDLEGRKLTLNKKDMVRCLANLHANPGEYELED